MSSSEQTAEKVPGAWQTFTAFLTDAGIGGGAVFLAIAQAEDWFAGAHWAVAVAGGVGAVSMPILLWVRICGAWQLMRYNRARRKWAEIGRDASRGFDT